MWKCHLCDYEGDELYKCSKCHQLICRDCNGITEILNGMRVDAGIGWHCIPCWKDFIHRELESIRAVAASYANSSSSGH